MPSGTQSRCWHVPSREYSIPRPNTQLQMSSGHQGDGTRLDIHGQSLPSPCHLDTRIFDGADNPQ